MSVWFRGHGFDEKFTAGGRLGRCDPPVEYIHHGVREFGSSNLLSQLFLKEKYPMLTKAIAAGAALLLFTAGVADAAVFDVNATLKAAAQAAPNAAGASGTLSGELDTNTKAFSYEVNYSGLTGPVMAAHFRGLTTPASQPTIAAQTPANPIEGTTTLTDSDIANLEAGKWSLDLQTAAHPSGEISGQLQATRREEQDALQLN